LRKGVKRSHLGILCIITTVLAACAGTVDMAATVTPQATPTNLPLPTSQPVLQELFPGEFSDCVLAVEATLPPFTLPEPLLPDHVAGNTDNPAITMVVYNDMQCPYCAAFHQVTKLLLQEYPDELQVIYRHLPLFMVHGNAFIAAQALEAAALQRETAFFELQNHLFTHQGEWQALSQEDFSSYLRDLLPSFELDPDLFEQAMIDEEMTLALLNDLDTALQAGITTTPFILLNGQVYTALSRDLSTIRTIIELELLKERQFDQCPPRVIEEDTSYTATLHTSQGDIIIKLYPEYAPLAVNNFLFLAQHGWYDQLPFYMVIPDEFALTGDPTGSSMGTPGYTFRSETNPALTFDRAGVVAMNNAGSPNTNGSQFFITYGPLPSYNGKFTIFGQVLQGLDVLQNLTPRNPASDPTIAPADLLLSVTIDAK
jgi:cyclophilin family peptidyl-prolyl cis-trans isomerase/protein-disulfide isomerase